MLIPVGLAALLNHCVSYVEMCDIGTQGPHHAAGCLIGGGKMGQIRHQAKVMMGHSHISRKPGRQGHRPNQRRLIHIIVKYLQLHHHALLGGMAAHTG